MSISSTNLTLGGLSLSGGLVVGQSVAPRQAPVQEVNPPKTEVVTGKEISPELLQHAVEDANKLFGQMQSDVRFVVDKESNKVVIKLVEPMTGEVLNQYPTEDALAISNAITRVQQLAAERHAAYKSGNNALAGLLFNHKI